jgi:hypothetical protein
LLALVASCNVYDASLLDDATAGDANAGAATADAGTGSIILSQNGGGSDTAGDAPQPQQAGASSHPSNGGASGGGGSDSRGNAGSGSGSSSGGTGVVVLGGAPGVAGGAGSAGSGASGAGGAPSGETVSDLLDDMEDGNFYLPPKPPRYGYWYVAGDETVGAKLPKIEALVGTLMPARAGSTSAVHFVASGFRGWGASVGLTFADAKQKRAVYDSGDALGVSFWVRGSIADGAKLRVLFPSFGSDPSGTICGGTGQGQCLDHFATQVSVTSTWQEVTILFSSLHQAGWGVPLTAFERAQMLGIEWTADTADADVWIDDLSLIHPH